MKTASLTLTAVAAAATLGGCIIPDHDPELLRRLLFPASAEGDPKALIGGFRAGQSWKRVRGIRDEILRLREDGAESSGARPVRSLYLYLEGSDRNALTFNFDLRDGDVDGVTMQLVGEGDDNRELIHGMAAEAYAWLDRRFGPETSWCSDAGEAFPVDGAFHKKLEKDTTCWWKVGDSTVAELTRTHHGPETPGRTYVELAVRMRLEGLPEAPSPAR